VGVGPRGLSVRIGLTATVSLNGVILAQQAYGAELRTP